MKSWLQDNEMEMYSTHNEGKHLLERQGTKKIYDFSIKKVYIDKLDDIVDKYNNTYHRIIKMKPADINSSTYTDFNK